ncbi:MAG: hypothetical protein K2R98_06625 [Gemmataceae bacterium]|nr:hypothetical protein [Gemmataceae bacterium]
MGFFSGRATCARYRVTGRSPRTFGPEQLEQLAKHAIGRQRHASGDGVEVGWTAADHILDTDFDLAKNIVNDTLHFALRVDSQKVPADLLRAYTAVELRALSAENPSGHPSQRQRKEARASAAARLEAESADGRYLRRKAYEVLWDAQSNELLVGTTAVTIVDRLYTLFQVTFNRTIEPLHAGKQAFRLAELREQTRGVDDAAPAAFVGGEGKPIVAWCPDETSRDFLGNEFLLWLWYVLDAESDIIRLSDDSEVSAMLARTLVLECPRGQTGRESITSAGPAQLPEARRAIQAGKLPRKAGLTLARHDHVYELTLQAETLALTSIKFPASEEDDDRARLEERVTQLRHLMETVDLLYDVFGRHRTSASWTKDLAKIQKWLKEDGSPQRRASV